MRVAGKATAVILAVLWGLAAARAAEPIPYEKPADAAFGPERQPTWQLGFKTNTLRVYPPKRECGAVSGICPLKVDNEFRPRRAATAAEWEKIRPEIRKAVTGYFGSMPPGNIPLAPRVQPDEDKEDYLLRRVSIAFDDDLRGKMVLLIPKGAPRPGPAVLVYDAWGGGIQRAAEGVYSRAIAIHLARAGFIAVALDHWYQQFGKSAELSTIGAAVHFTRRTVDYLRTQKDLVAPDKIAIFGHVYGAEVAQFAAAMDDRIAAVVASCSWLGPTRHYSAAFWAPPFWVSGRAGMQCINRASLEMYCSRRRVSSHPLPFLTQEMLALIAPRPLLGINTGMQVGVGARANPAVYDCLRPVWALYGRPWALELIDHRWKTNEPVNARDFTIDFLCRAMCGIHPGKAPAKVVGEILADVRSGKSDRQLRGARLAAWWRLRQAKKDLAGLVGSEGAALRRVAAKALERIGAMDELFKHIEHEDPMTRIAAVEAMQLYGTKEQFQYLVRNDQDFDRWVNEAKWQTLQIHPWE